MINELPIIRDVVDKYKLAQDKRLGQNFIFDLNVTDKIARTAGRLDDCTVIEIGPGPGALTRSILDNGAKKLYSIDKDKRCIAALNDYLVPHYNGRLEIIEGDALDAEIYNKIEGKIKIISNLPYNISTELLSRWLDNVEKFTSFTLMFQKEVVERLAAKPRTKDYGRLSVKTQWLCDVYHEFNVPSSVFFPPPKVTSAIAHIVPKKGPIASANIKDLEHVCKVTFGQRRKRLSTSLKQLGDGVAKQILQIADIDGKRRPEELSVEEFCALARAFSEVSE